MGLFPPGAPEPGRVRLPRASEAQAHSRPVVCALELIFPQKQSSSGGWLLAWLQGTVLSSQLQPQTFTPPHCLRLAGALMGASETTDPLAPLPRPWGCGNWGPQKTYFI